MQNIKELLRHLFYIILIAFFLHLFMLITSLSFQVIVVVGACLAMVYHFYGFAKNAKLAESARPQAPTAETKLKKAFHIATIVLDCILIFLVLFVAVPFGIVGQITHLSLLIALAGVCLWIVDDYHYFVRVFIEKTNSESPPSVANTKRISNAIRNLIFFAWIFWGLDVIIFREINPDPNERPIRVFFPLDKVGETYAFDVTVRERRLYWVSILFDLYPPNKWSQLFDKTPSPQDYEHFKKVIGAGRFDDDKWIKPGPPAKFRVQIVKKIDSAIIVDELIDCQANRLGEQHKLRSTTADLVRQILSPDVYSVRLTYLESAPELGTLSGGQIWFHKMGYKY